NHLQVSVHYQGGSKESIATQLPYLKVQDASQKLQALQGDQTQPNMLILPITSDNIVSEFEKEKSLVVRGQYTGKKLSESEKITFNLDNQNFDAKIDDSGIFSAVIPAELLIQSVSKQLRAQVLNGNRVVSSVNHAFATDLLT
ncbi:hypothetical protein RJJ65_38135, partial [Rhizobium hidalgonense]